MKPYGMTTKDYGDTGCCPGHDKPKIKKWGGSYNSPHHKRNFAQNKKFQNRMRRHVDKQSLEKENGS